MSGGNKSRLDKLVNLLEAGSTSVICKAAAQQIASTAQTHPQHLPSLLRRIQPLLQHKRWETRTATGECIGLIAEHVQHATAADVQAAAAEEAGASLKLEDGAAASSSKEAAEGALSLAAFDLERVVQMGTPLLASGGQEYDLADNPSLSHTERLAKQRKHLKSRLGLGGPVDQLMDTADLIKDEDLVEASGAASAPSGNAAQQKDASALISEMTGLSARERNKLKRDLKRKGSSVLQTQASLGQAKRSKADTPAQEVSAEAAAAAAEEAAATWQDIISGRWPFGALCDQMCMDVLSPVWEVRHGAAVALREVLRSHAASAGIETALADEPSGWMVPGGSGRPRLAPATAADAAAAAASNQAWLEDCALRLLCTLALDRFGDFVSDQVVAPVRETAAQALGAAARSLPPAKLGALAKHLAALVRRPEWEVRLGGLLGLKYLLAARSDAAASLLQEAVPAALAGLQDGEDDVRAVSAEALLPVAALLASQGEEAVGALMSALWDILLEVDELSPSTGSVMQLLNQLQGSCAEASSAPDQARLTQRLWPFFRHPMPPVRLAAVKLFVRLVSFPAGAPAEQQRESEFWHPESLTVALRLTFQSLLLENNTDVLAATQEAWMALVQSAPAGALLGACSGDLLHSWLRLASTAAGQPLEPSLLLDTPTASSGQGQEGGGKKGKGAASNGHGPKRWKPLFGGGEKDGSCAVLMRSEAAKALGFLAAAWQPGVNLVAEQLLRQLDVPQAAAKVLCGLTALHWALENRKIHPTAAHSLPDAVLEKLQTALAALASVPGPTGSTVYEEAAPYYAQLRAHAVTLCSALKKAGYSTEQLFGDMPSDAALAGIGTDAASALAGLVTADVAASHPAAADAAAALAGAAAAVASVEAFLHGSVTAVLAAALVQAGHTPAKLNVIIQPLMAGLRREPDPILRRYTAEALASFVFSCTDRTPSPNDRIVKNLCAMACADPAETPSASAPDPPDDPPSDDASASAAGRENGEDAQGQDPSLAAAAVARKGAEAALQALAGVFGTELLQKLPRLWEHVSSTIAIDAAAAAPGQIQPPSAEPQAVIDTLQVLKVLGPALDADLEPQLATLMPGLAACCLHQRRVVHSAAAGCAESLASARPARVLPSLLRCAL